MERAKSIRFHWPMVLLCLFIFLCAVFIPIDSARCERDIGSIDIYSKYPDGPVVVPEMDFAEPGNCPWGWGALTLTGCENNVFEPQDKQSIEILPRTKMKYYSFFMLYLLNQLLYGK